MPTRTPGEALEAAHARIRRGLDAFPADLELLGATARLLAVTGQPTEALARQLEAARGWAIRSGEVGLSFPLAEGYRLAVGLADGAAFAALEALHAEGLAQRMLRQPADTRFVDLWHGEALARFGRPDEGRAVLTAVFAASGGLYPGVGAARALSALLPRDEATALGAQLLSYRARFEREATPHTAERVADIDSTLARIDLAAACRDEHPTLARHALERLRALSPGLMGILTNHAPPEARASELDLGRYVARFYSG